MIQFVTDAASSSWAHFTSWWFYPLVVVIYGPLMILVIFGVGGDATLAAHRLVAASAVMGWAYDTTWRKRKRKPHRR